MIFSNMQLTIKDALPILPHLLKDILYQLQNKEDIEAATRLNVPLKVEIAAGKNWDGAHKCWILGDPR